MSLQFQVRRQPSSAKATLGDFYYSTDGVVWERVCYTLEDVVREVQDQPVTSWKIPNQTAIPLGTYSVILSLSPHFTTLRGCPTILPELLNVPGFSGVRIHGGNTDADTEGCLLVAHNRLGPDYIQGSAEADVISLIRSNGGTATVQYLGQYVQ